MFEIKKEKIPIILIISSVVFAAISFSFIPFTGGDNFAYFSLARALAQGKGYIELWDVTLPPHTQYPPCFPILLLPAAFSNSYLLAKLTVFSCFVLSLFFSYRLFRDLDDSKSGILPVVALLLFAFTPVIFEYSSWVLSEIPYMFFSILSIYYWSKKKYNLSLLFAVVTSLTRTAGIALPIVVSVFYFFKFKTGKKKFIFPGLALLSVASWFIYSSLFRDPSQKSYIRYLLLENPYNPTIGNVNAFGLLNRAGQNIWAMINKVFPQMFWGEFRNFPLSLVIGIALFGFALFGVFGDKIFPGKTRKKVKKSPSIFSTINLMNIYSLLYLSTVWTWPVVWSADKRFYLPILPVFAFWIGKGLLKARDLIPEGTGKRISSFIIPGILAAHCIFISLVASPKLWKSNIKWVRYSVPTDEAAYFKSYINIKNWASREKIPGNSVFIVRKRPTFYHFTGFSTVRIPEAANLQELKNIIETNNVDYITLSAFFSSDAILSSKMEALTEEYNFIPVYMNPDGKTAVFKCEKKENSTTKTVK